MTWEHEEEERNKTEQVRLEACGGLRAQAAAASAVSGSVQPEVMCFSQEISAEACGSSKESPAWLFGAVEVMKRTSVDLK